MGSPRSCFDWLPGSKKALNNMSWPEGKTLKKSVLEQRRWRNKTGMLEIYAKRTAIYEICLGSPET